ncbi:MAG TPA: pitrilysin family protein, partial [bacterium]|nr:pitrilysin family protein [bacterium]
MLGLFRILPAAALAVAAPAWASELDLEDLIQEYHLDNGLTLIVVENHESPTLGLATAFSVGGAEERPGVGGVSHILEHMLFKGTPEVGTSDWDAEKPHHERIEELTWQMKAEKAKGRFADEARIEELLAERAAEQAAAKEYAVDNELWGLYEEAGGTNLNAFTSYDITAYILALPANRLELWMYLESSRLRDPVLRQFYTEVQNVMEERRLSRDADPEGKLIENFLSVAYDAHWYGQPIIGWPSDIESVTRTEAEDWFRTYYAPNRMTLSIVGDVDADEVHRMVQEYFGDIPRQDPPEPMETFELEHEGFRRIEVEYEAEPRLIMGWHKQNVPHPDDAALHVLSEVLTGGRSSRLERLLVEERQIAASVDSDHEFPGLRWPNLFEIDALPRAPHTTAEVEEAIWEQLEKVKREGITDRELEKAKNRIRAADVRELESNFGLAIELAYAQASHQDWRVIDEKTAAVEAVTADQVQDVARRTFRRNRTTVASLVKPAFEPDPEKEERGRQVVSRMVDALGGSDHVGEIRNARVTAALSINTPGGAMEAHAATVFRIPDGVRSEMTFFGQTAVSCVTESDAWRARAGEVSDIPQDERREQRADLERDLFLLAYPAVSKDYILQGLGEQEGMPAVEVRGPSGSAFTAYFDPSTGLPAKVAYDGTNPMTGESAPIVEEFSDFRAVGDVKRPHRTVTSV